MDGDIGGGTVNILLPEIKIVKSHRLNHSALALYNSKDL